MGVATGAYGISFGAISVASGLDVWQTCALSLLVFTGASQFALVGVIASGGTAAAAAGTAMLLGVRNGLYGLRLAPLLDWRGARRVGGAHLLIDESTAMAVNRATTAEARLGFVSTGLSVFVLWNLATLLRRAGRRADRRPAHLRARRRGGRRVPGPAVAATGHGAWPATVAVVAAAVALGLVPLVTPGLPVLAASSVALLGLLPRAPRPPGPTVPRAARGGPVIWAAVLAAALGCYLLKLAGLAVPSVGARAAVGGPGGRPAPGRSALRPDRRPGARRGPAARPRRPRSSASPPPSSPCCCGRRSSSWWASPRSHGRPGAAALTAEARRPSGRPERA